jgi:hypothetical protein
MRGSVCFFNSYLIQICVFCESACRTCFLRKLRSEVPRKFFQRGKIVSVLGDTRRIIGIHRSVSIGESS